MKTIKCELCNKEILEESCVFALHKRIIEGEEHCFCCKLHGDKFDEKG
jgi:hypothetical protein